MYLGGKKMCTGMSWSAASKNYAKEVMAVNGHVMCCMPFDADAATEQNNGTKVEGGPWVLGDVLEAVHVSTASITATMVTTIATTITTKMTPAEKESFRRKLAEIDKVLYV